MQITEFWVKRKALRETRIVQHPAAELAAGEVRLEIEKFALTANNISYALTGEAIGYWGYFPAEGEWGKVPAWGFARVVETRSADLSVGERLWGFLPMASHLTLLPGRIKAAHCLDISAHRQALPALYNQYQRTTHDPSALRDLEDERCLLFPLFATSYILYDYLIDHDFFHAAQVVIASASSKTALGLAYLIHHHGQTRPRVLGLTSERNLGFVTDLGVCDEVLPYDSVSRIDPGLRTAFVDMSGDRLVVRSVHQHLGENLVDSCLVGATHWEAGGKDRDLPGARPTFFFAPKRFAKRDQEWGPGVVLGKAFAAAADIAVSLKGRIAVEHHHGAAQAQALYLQLLDNAIAPQRGLMLSLAD